MKRYKSSIGIENKCSSYSRNMQLFWGILLIAGLAWSTAEAYDADFIATEVLTRMNATAASQLHAYTLPGFQIRFSVREIANWTVQSGQAVSAGLWVKNGTASYERSGNSLYLAVPISIHGFRSNYTFSCSDDHKRAGTYKISTIRDYFASVKLRISYGGPFDCEGNVISVHLAEIPDCAYSDDLTFDIEGGQVSGSCVWETWNAANEYLIPFRSHFCNSYIEEMNRLIYKTAEKAIQGFNFCEL